MRKRRVILGLSFFLMARTFGTANSQSLPQNNPPVDSATGAVQPAVPQLDKESPNATVAPVVEPALWGIGTSNYVQLGSPVSVCARGLKEWTREGNDPNSLRLVLAGHMLSNLEPTGISPTSQEYVNFMVKFDGSDKQDRDAWADIFDAARNTKDRRLSITLGQREKRQAFESDVYAVFVLYPWYWPLVILLLFLLLLALLSLAWKTDLLRDTTAGRPPTPLRPPLSLGRVQMAWWFYWVIAAFVYIWLITSAPHVPTASVLGLLGISATTGLAAVAVDKGKVSDSLNQRKALETEQAALVSRIREIEASGTLEQEELKDKKSRLATTQASIERLPPVLAPPASHGIANDLLTDGDGISFHRFQMLVWTAVLGIVFVRSVYRDFSMPEFDPAILALMGVYSGTYVGFKFPEKPKVG